VFATDKLTLKNCEGKAKPIVLDRETLKGLYIFTLFRGFNHAQIKRDWERDFNFNAGMPTVRGKEKRTELNRLFLYRSRRRRTRAIDPAKTVFSYLRQFRPAGKTTYLRGK